MNGNSNVGNRCDNGRDGGGTAGKEHRYKFPAVDTARHDEAKATMTPGTALQGESSREVGSTANTMEGGRGVVNGRKYNHSFPDRGFQK